MCVFLTYLRVDLFIYVFYTLPMPCSKHHVWVMDIPPSLGFPSNGYIDPYFYERINDVLTTAHKPQNG